MVMDRDHLHGSLGDGVGEHLPRVYRGGPRSQSGVGSLPLGGQEPFLQIAVACVEVKPGSTQAANRGRVQMCGLFGWKWQGKVSWALAWAMRVTRR